MKKINCKLDFSSKEEIEARRLRKNALGENEQIFEERLRKVYGEYRKNMEIGFYEYMLKNDKILYSVFERIGGIKEMYNYLAKYDLL